MADDSSYVGRASVIDVLQRHGVEVSCDDGGVGGPGMVILVKGEKLDARKLPAEVSRPVLRYLARLFDIPIHHSALGAFRAAWSLQSAYGPNEARRTRSMRALVAFCDALALPLHGVFACELL